jgi:hypothetical protein
MKSKNKYSYGLSLIEVIIYTALLSILMATSVTYAYTMFEYDLDLMGDIHDTYY